MTPEKWQRVRDVLAEALERKPEDRPAFLERACSDLELRREVERCSPPATKAAPASCNLAYFAQEEELPAIHDALGDQSTSLAAILQLYCA